MERGSDDRRHGNRSDDTASSAARTHNARDLRSANRPDRERSPEIDEDVKGDELDRVTRAQIRNLEERSALWVAKHLVMAGRLIDLDPELAFQHALAASRRGGRLAAVREAVGLTAYAAGHYGEALREFRTFRRISGSNVHLPVMADCERGLGRPDRALDLARSEEAETLDAAGKAELAMVISGARTDLGQLEAAVSALEIPQLDLHRAFSFSPRLFRAYADALDAVGRSDESGRWRRQAGVAEKALGLDDDLEPDIIDLGEDDDDAPAPVPVPRVADVLGGAAAAPVAAPADAAPDGSGAAGVDTGFRDAGIRNEDAEAGTRADAIDAADAGLADGVPAPGPSRSLEGDPATDGELAASTTDEAGTVLPDEAGTVLPDEAADAPGDAGSAGNGTGEAEAAEGAVAADAVPAGETSHPVQALQTEMLFSMDDAGAADIPAPQAEEAVQEPQAARSTTVEFSEAASGPRTGDVATGGQAGDPSSTDTSTDAGQDGPAPRPERAATSDQPDVVDD
ncbi:hypothetical protein [Arthrobacter sp. NPDC092385]|uniref:hypothetical protein n=1 Tax=Arthrobacter sp. NPDC092385 TaxID=3363943 RepID=UPI003830F60F